MYNVFIKGAKAKEERGEREGRRRKSLNFNPQTPKPLKNGRKVHPLVAPNHKTLISFSLMFIWRVLA